MSTRSSKSATSAKAAAQPGSKNQSSPSPQNRGSWAENLAADWLATTGLTLQSKNFQRRFGEIDLIFRNDECGTWVFVEVKYRGLNATVSGIESVSPSKQRKLLKTAELFLQRVNDSTSEARIDVVTITPVCTPTPTSTSTSASASTSASTSASALEKNVLPNQLKNQPLIAEVNSRHREQQPLNKSGGKTQPGTANSVCGDGYVHSYQQNHHLIWIKNAVEYG